MLVGIDARFQDEVRRRSPENVDITGRVSREELRRLYRASSVYFQPSRVEGLPNAVCEAMLCGCVPVCTDVGGMKTPVSGNGYLVPWGDPAGLASAIMNARARAPEAGQRARDSIASRFTPDRRERGLLEAFAACAR